jgi:thioredoxin reductase
MGQTSHHRVYAAGDLATGMQSALGAAAAGARIAAILNHRLILEDRRVFERHDTT